MSLSLKMLKFEKIVLIVFFISIFASVIYFMWKTFSGIRNDTMDFDASFEFFENYMIMFVAFIVIILIAHFARIVVQSREMKNTPHATLPDEPDPMDYEHWPLNHCPQCGCNLGKRIPKYCPECGYKVKNDFYHK